jgi:O-antigen/teichoic acid export membrane protein
LGISLFFSSLKTIPSVLLERELDFGKLVIPQVLENLAYNLIAVFLAWKGFGIRSFTYAVFIRGIVGLVAIYVLRPWMPGFALSKKSLKKLLTFGIPYQLNTFLATMKDDGMTVFLGGILGTAGIGFLGWAQKWAYMPLRLFMDNVLKVTFPAFSRMQDEREHLKRSVTRSIFFVCFLVFPSVVGLVILSPMLVEIIPRYDKWEPALIPLFLISINTIFAAATTQLTNLLNAIGLTWVFVPVLAIKYGVNGAALGYALVGSSSIIAVYIVRRHVKFSLVEGIFRPVFAAALMGVALILTRKLLPVNLYSIGLLIGVGFAVYVVTIYLLVGPSIVADVRKVFNNLVSRK